MKIKWMLSVAGSLVAAMGAAQISFTESTSILNDPTHYSGNALTVQDIDGNGLDDIVILDQATNLVIEFQQSDGSFTTYLGGMMDDQNAWGMVVADTDNNGFGDIVSGVNGENPDYAKADANGSNWVINSLSGYPLFYQGSSFGDVDNDGDVDLYVCADTDESAIWENDGNGGLTFSGTSLIDLTVQGWDGSGNYGSTFTDFDLDGDLDLYVSHCRQGVNDPSDPRRINQLFENDGNNNYTENASAYGLDIGSQTWTSDFGDIDNDGDFDIIMTNHDVSNMLWENLDDSDQYQDIFDDAIGVQQVGFPLQSIFKDFDNDGFLDILITGNNHVLYRNNGDMTFTPVDGVFPGGDILSMAVGDLNHDGFLDIYASYGNIYNSPSSTPDAIWLNDGNDNHFITLNLEGTVTNQDAIGTQVRIYGDWGMQVREVRSGESYGIVNSLHTHFGIGQSTAIDSIVIDWPTSGIHQVISDPAIDQFMTVVEGQCVAADNIISADGAGVLCAGESLTLSGPTAPFTTYQWSTGETSPEITITQGGVYMLELTDTISGCSSISPSFTVLEAPDETPSITIGGDVEFCEGASVTLTSSPADGYSWSVNGETTQSIEVTSSGDYAVTITGACADFTSASVQVTVLDSPDMPTASDVVVASGEQAILTASGAGDELRWYENETGGAVLGVGTEYTTAVIDAPTSYWVEDVYIYEGSEGTGGKAENGNGQHHTNSDFYLIFDAYEEFTINEVKVYADVTGTRTIQLRDEDGGVIESETLSISAGESYIPLGFVVPEGEGYSLRATGDPGLWRDNDPAGVNFPYPLATYGVITGTNVNPDNADNYYYFFYDWQVSIASTECQSAREEVAIDITTGLDESDMLQGMHVFPNPSEGVLTLQFRSGIAGGPILLELLDMEGRILWSEQRILVEGEQRISLELNDVAEGMYLLRMIAEDAGTTRSIHLR